MLDRGRIVVADDDPIIRALVTTQLTRSGATVIEALDGAEALAACRAGDVDLAIIDVEMPHLSGFEVLETLRADPATAGLPVLLLTAHTMVDDVAKGLGLGAHDYIRKPFDLLELQARVDSAILLNRRARQLAESENAFRGLFEGAHTAMAIVGPGGEVRRVNPAWAELLDRPIDQVKGLDTASLLHPDDAAAYRAMLAEMRAGPAHARLRVRLLRPSGEVRWSDVSSTLVRDHAGAPAHLYHVIVDVTDEVLANEALVASEHRYRHVVDLAAEGIWILDAQRTITFANEAIATMLGRSVSDLLGRRLEDLMDEDGWARAQEHRRRREAGISETVENSLVHADGHLVWVRVSATPILDQDGDLGSLAVLADVTAQREMERALAEREHRYATLVEHLPGSAVLVLDRDLRVVTAGGAALRDAGYQPAALVGVLLEDVLADPDFRFIRPMLINALSGRPSGTFEFAEVNGRVSLIDAMPLLSDRLGVDQILVAIRDVTALKQAEAALRAAEESSRAAFERAPVGMAVLTPAGLLDKVNNALVALLGHSRAHLIGRSDLDLTFAEDVESTAAALAQLASSELTTCSLEKRYIHADGHLVWVALSAASVRDGEGALSYLLAHYVDISDRKLAAARLEHLADHDPLTGLLNRRGFAEALARQSATVRRYGPTGAVLMLDLDNLKQLNDSAGHQAGDQLIVGVADLLRTALRETDVIARLGGDEFAVILSRAAAPDAEIVADRIVRTARESLSMAVDGPPRRYTVSVGIAMFDLPDAVGDTVVAHADSALYAAKRAGRDRYEFHSPKID
jgi:diguanylate cyclase (GGDEF)-like protein/PAS domain S-box-containing protein